MSPRWTRPAVVIPLALALALVGCKRPATPSVGSAAPRIVETGPPVSEKEAEEFGQQVATAFTAQDADGLARLIRVEDLCERSISDFNLTAAERKSATDGFRKRDGAARICRGWADQMAGVDVKLLRTRTRDGQQSALVRFIGDEIGTNYFEFTLARGADGQPRVEDVYLFVAGESLTQLIRRIMLAALPVRQGGGGRGQLYLDHAAALRQLQESVRAGKMAEGRRVYSALPQALRDEKWVILIGLRTLEGDDPAHLAELERYRRLFPKDPSLDLVLVSYHLLKKDATRLRECLWRVDEAVGGDPSLRLIDADYRFSQGDYAEARRLASEAVKLEPTLKGAYWVLINSALAEDDHAETLHQIKMVVEKCNFPLDAVALKDDEAYKRFGNTKEYRELVRWMERRAK